MSGYKPYKTYQLTPRVRWRLRNKSQAGTRLPSRPMQQGYDNLRIQPENGSQEPIADTSAHTDRLTQTGHSSAELSTQSGLNCKCRQRTATATRDRTQNELTMEAWAGLTEKLS